jgi:hypothetical protein
MSVNSNSQAELVVAALEFSNWLMRALMRCGVKMARH